MRKYWCLVCILVLLVGCANVEKEIVKESREVSLENEVIEIMKENDAEFDAIIDYDLKDNSIIVVYDGLGTNGLSVAIIQQTTNGLEWVKTHDATTPITTITDEGNLFVTIVRPRDEDFTEVKVFDQHAKLVTYYNNSFEGVTIEEKYWIAYTNNNPDAIDDIELIRK